LTPANEVQAIEGYFKGEGYIDLTGLQFTILDNDPTIPTPDGPTVVEVAVVRVPTDVCPTPSDSIVEASMYCPKDKWMEHIGIGTRLPESSTGSNGGFWWCCNTRTPQGGCPVGLDPSMPQLIVNPTVMDGTRRVVNIDHHFTATIPPEDAQFVSGDNGGYFIVLLSYCDTTQSAISVNGEIFFVSFADEVHQIVQEEVPFYGITSLLYMAVFFWYAYLMHQNADSRIDLEEWIFGALAIGLVQSLLRFVEFIVWRQSGHRNAATALLAAAAFGVKHGVVRGLLVLLCSGVGVTRPNLENHRLTLWSLVTMYIVCTTIAEYLDYVQQTRNADIAGLYETGSLAQIEGYLLLISSIIDLIFVIWIPTALRETMAHLRSTNQERKLERFRHLMYIICTAVGLTVLTFLFIIVDIVSDDARIATRFDPGDVNEISVYLVLLLVAIVWRPNPMAREYAYVMEAPTEELDGGTPNDLELVESTSMARRATETISDDDYKSFPIDSAEPS
jgi:hypothetical protein